MQNPDAFVKQRPNKVVIIGDANVGKTCIIDRITEDKFDATQPTIGALHKTKTINDTLLDIWDTAGQERFKSMVPMYYKGAKAIMVAFDITNQNSFEGAKKWFTEIESNTSNVILVIVGNKSDLESKRVVSMETAKQFADEKKITYYETSAKDNVNVNEVFTFLADKIKSLNQRSEKGIDIKRDSSSRGTNPTCQICSS